MKIYTKNGDKGQTGLIGGTNVPKNDPRIEAYGTVDELNSFIGLLASYPLRESTAAFLEKIQHNLFVIGSYLATDTQITTHSGDSILSPEVISDKEKEIDIIQSGLPELRSFVLPGGSSEAAVCHICRTVCRRAERRIVEISELYSVDHLVIIYVNRLSDYFFVLSRELNIGGNVKEILWKK